jgi:hypothetical protein
MTVVIMPMVPFVISIKITELSRHQNVTNLLLAPSCLCILINIERCWSLEVQGQSNMLNNVEAMNQG